jgi:hypothetical protein
VATYAPKTTVSSEKSRNEIERTLQRYGASKFMYGTEDGRAIIVFEMKDRRIRFDLPMPDRESRQFTRTPTGLQRTPSAASQAWEQACRQRWRALALGIKAKLELIESGITVFEEEFLAHIVLPNSMTVGQWMLPQVAEVYERGDMPAMLPEAGQKAIGGSAIDAEFTQMV